MRTLIIIALMFLGQLSVGQTTYQGACCDDNGKPSNPADASLQGYAVKKHKAKTAVDLNIKSVRLGSETVNLDVHYNGKVSFETDMVNLNDSVAVKLVLGKTKENGLNKFLYKLLVYKHDENSDCWRPLSTFNAFYEVYDQTINLNLYGIGYEGSSDYFQIQEGWVRLN